MTTAATIPNRGRVESDRLTTALLNLTSRGQRPHCSDPETHHYWLSEEQHERALAIRGCQHCPVLTECRNAAEAQRETFGVYGAKDFTKHPRKPIQHRVADIKRNLAIRESFFWLRNPITSQGSKFLPGAPPTDG
jgi:hypothetical protein